jgi:hypothetical protein
MPSLDNPSAESLPRWSVERRLEFIERRLLWEGRINRFDLVAHFGVSPNQATADLKRFEASHPGALAYDTRARTYRAGAGLRPPGDNDVRLLLRELRLIAEGVIPQADGSLATAVPLALAEAPLRLVPAAILAVVIAAIRDHLQLVAVYQSFSTPEPRKRRLEPHALVFDGFRWHARARDVDENRFKDFVLGRLSEVVTSGVASVAPAEDRDWWSDVDLVIAPHPGLSAHQRAIIAADYGMVDAQLVLRVRQAVAFYVKRRLGLVPGHESLAANDQQIVLLDEPPLTSKMTKGFSPLFGAP